MSVDDLEVVGHSETLDGAKWLSPDYSATHHSAAEDIEDGHMNLLVEGFERGPMVLSLDSDGECTFLGEAEFRSDVEHELVEIQIAPKNSAIPEKNKRIR